MYQHIKVPSAGQKITVNADMSLNVPDQPVIPYIEGDGTGFDITPVMLKVVDAAVAKAYGGKKKIHWMEVFAGEKSTKVYGPDVWLPEETLHAIRDYVVSIKGPLTTPVGGGIRSLNVTLRQVLDLYACVRPVRWFEGVPAPVKEPGKLNVIIFRENTEDVYAGIEWKSGSAEAARIIEFIKGLGKTIRHDSGIGIKPISKYGSERIIRKALQFAIDKGRKQVTMVHKGNIMKFTEGAFRDWGYELAAREFPEHVISEKDLWDKHDGKLPAGKVLLNDRIADSMFQQLLLRPDEYDVLATPNLNGDYLSDACAAQVGGLGLAPGGNISDAYAVFEATHGTAPKYADKDVINPGSVILSGVMMFEYLGWDKAAKLIVKGIERSIRKKRVTYDFERLMKGATKLKCSEFGSEIIANM